MTPDDPAPPAEPSSFSVGAIVYLRSGGPPLTVVEPRLRDDSKTSVSWLDGGQLQEADFPTVTLTAHSPEGDGPAEAEPVVRTKQTDREPLAAIQERLRVETQRGLSGGKVRRGKQL